jgi:putative proteasome-type protease
VKYGKPILDRIIQRGTSLSDAAKCALISFDSTMRSNLSVGPPLDLPPQFAEEGLHHPA